VSCAVSFVFDCVFLCVVSFDDCMISKIWGRLNSTISAGMEIDLCRGFPPEWKSVCSVDFRRVEKGQLKEGGQVGCGQKLLSAGNGGKVVKDMGIEEME